MRKIDTLKKLVKQYVRKESDIYSLSIPSEFRRKGDCITADTTLTAIPVCEDGKLVGVAIIHPYIYEGEMSSWPEVFRFGCSEKIICSS